MVQHRISLHHRNSAARLAVVVVPIKLEWADEGKVVTETSTEYKEVTDDSDFADVGSGLDGRLSRISNGGSDIKRLPTQIPVHVKTILPSQGIGSKSSSPSSSDDESSTFEEDVLKKHNEYRKKHGCLPLKIDKKLCSYAQEWANKLAKENKFEHRRDVPYGENLYCTWSSNPKRGCPGSNVVESWYSEIEQHEFGVEPRSMGTGHFTQVIWKNSKNLGIAKAQSSTGKVIVVANYEPAGNFVGQYVENVPPPKS